MENLDDIFRTALQYFVDNSGKSQRKFATEDLSVQPSFLNDLLKQRKYGNEATRRKIAEALGYPGSKYEDFLNIGRRELGLIKDDGTSLDQDQGPKNAEAEKWKSKYLDELKSHDETLNSLLAARRKIAELEKRGGADHGGGGERRVSKKKDVG